MSARYAVYFVPQPESLSWRLGCLWHGRDPASGARFDPPLPGGLTPRRYEEIVASARRYGFHATLKPPFELAIGVEASDLRSEIEAFAGRQTTFAAPALRIARIGGFLALTLNGKSAAMDHLCADCVVQLDRYRAPPSQGELDARRKHGLSARQEELLLRWGYPYVMDEWRFHMTLTTWLEEPELSLIEAHLAQVFRPIMASPLYVDRIALFAQEDRATEFRLEASFLFGR